MTFASGTCVLCDDLFAATDPADANGAAYAAAATTAASAAASLVEPCNISEYLLLLLRVLRKIYDPNYDCAQDCIKSCSSTSPSNPLYGTSMLSGANQFEFHSGSHAIIGIISATFPLFWMQFIRTDLDLSAISPAIARASSRLSALHAPAPCVVMTVLLAALKHHAHVRAKGFGVTRNKCFDSSELKYIYAHT